MLQLITTLQLRSFAPGDAYQELPQAGALANTLALPHVPRHWWSGTQPQANNWGWGYRSWRRLQRINSFLVGVLASIRRGLRLRSTQPRQGTPSAGGRLGISSRHWRCPRRAELGLRSLGRRDPDGSYYRLGSPRNLRKNLVCCTPAAARLAISPAGTGNNYRW